MSDFTTLLAAFPEAVMPAPVSDYDYAGYVKKYGEPDQTKGQHLTDEFKLPNHITFSTGSMYSTPENPGGTWAPTKTGGWNFTPSAANLKHSTPEQLKHYFLTREKKGTTLTLPDGTVVEGTND